MLCECVFERPDLAQLTDDDVLDRLERCGDCPAARTPAAQVLLARLQRSTRELRRTGSRARELTRALTELRAEADRSELRISNLERVQKVSTRELVQKNAFISLIATITLAASEATSDDAVYDVCMRKLCAAAGWSLARVVPSGGGPDRWHVADAAAAEFIARIPAGEPSEPGHEALRTGRPAWRGDLAAPWRSVAALPVIVEAQPLVVLEFFGPTADGNVPALLVTMATVGAQLARVLARRRAEEALAAARDAAEEASRAKSNFLASVSHELRTPLNAILGYAELMHEILDERDIPDLREDVRRIRQAGEHLLGLIDNILDLSKVEAERMPVVLERFNLARLLRECAALLAPLIERRGNTVALELGSGLSAIETDPQLVRQIVFNLVSNAAKFTSEGTITITAAREPAAAGPHWLRLAVADTGIGMSDEQCANLFRPYQQLDHRRDRGGGTGLGLALCRGLCTLLGGTIAVTSAPGRGSTFTVRIPLGPAGS